MLNLFPSVKLSSLCKNCVAQPQTALVGSSTTITTDLHRSPTALHGVPIAVTLYSAHELKYLHAYSHRCDLYSTAICADPYTQLTPLTPMIELLLIILIVCLGLVICRDAL